MTEFCRICLVPHNELIMIKCTQSEDMFEECLNIKLESIPQYKICMDCNIQLKYFYDFKKKALENHEKLLNYQTNVSLKLCDISLKLETIVKEESIVEILNDNEMNIITHDSNYEIEYLDSEKDIEELSNINKSIEVEYDEGQSDMINFENTNSEEFKFSKILIDLHDDRLQNSGNDNIIIENHLEDKSPKKLKKFIKRTFQCPHCQKKFRSEKTYSAHMHIHEGLLPWICEVCGKGFEYRINYNYHIKNHKNNRNFICPICSKAYICKWDLKVHESVHTKERPYSCDLCKKTFRIQSHWKQHLQTHNNTNSVECSICKQKYKSKASLKIHINSIHSDKNFLCKLCDKKFNRKHHLKVHLITHTKKDSVNRRCRRK